METMEVLKKTRRPLRSSFTKTSNQLEEEMNSEDPNADRMATFLEQLEQKGKKLYELDQAILELLQVDSFTQEEYDDEFNIIDGYNDRLIECQTKARRLLSKLERSTDEDDNRSQASSFSVNPSSLRKFKLPKIELKKFGGELKEWLGFWGQFQKIDSDESIALEDKYQYLLQSTIPKSKAREIVESFPPTAENYTKAIEYLKSRFGREEVLVEVYIRDLLRLVMNNAINPKQKVTLSVLYDKLETQLRALESLNVASEKYAAMLYPLVESCLPDEVIRTWERTKGFKVNDNDSESPNRLMALMKFLRDEVEGEERIKMARTGFGFESENKKKLQKPNYDENESELPTAASLINSNPRKNDKNLQKCIFCDRNNHASQDCFQAKKMTPEQKRQIVTRIGCCFNCLRKGHIAKFCIGKQRCTSCNKRHYTIMCNPSFNSDDPTRPTGKSEDKPTKDNVLTNQTCSSSVVLQTLKVYARGKNGRRIFRALIDTGSQKSYITSKAANLMGYKAISEEKIVHSLFGGQESEPQNHRRFRIFITSLDESYNCNFEALDQQRICGKICSIPEGNWTQELRHKGITLTDSSQYSGLRTSAEELEHIDILIGADIAGKLYTGEVYNLSSGLVAVGTKLGWTIMGKIPQEKKELESTMSYLSLHVANINVSDLWRLDRIGISDPTEVLTKVEIQKEALEKFEQTLNVNAEGRYEISLPWIESHPTLSDGYRLAEKRLISATKKMKDTNILEPYQEVFQSWKEEGIIEETTPYEEKELSHYLPHRAVIKEYANTKIRPVFDASAHEKDSPSLNSCLETGPNLLELVPSILIRFRMRQFGVVADIRRAFLQISVKETDRDFLRFLWMEDGDPERMKIYRHCRVVFGLNCGPFLLGATIAHHLKNVPTDLEETANVLRESFYVDNCVASLDDAEKLQKFISESKKIMLSAKFDLRDWKYSASDTPDLKLSQKTAEVEIIPVLGLNWNLNTDTIFCDISLTNLDESTPVTKRKILSLAQKIYDPLGFVSPTTLLPKLLLQECWLLKVSWDQELPNHIVQKFVAWRDQLAKLKDIQIPRWMIGECCSTNNLTLHVFADASKCAYAACIFVRVENAGQVSCQLVRAKTRVSPLKPVTIPRLELLACCIATRLADTVKKDMREPEIKTFYWSDSTNALCWIKRNENWAVFVANRVKEIRTFSRPEDWHHVPGKMNPADVPSRGCSVNQLIESKWWEGPDWLRLPPEDWPENDFDPDEESINTERRKTMLTTTNTEKEIPWYCKRFSSFLKTVRVIAWIRRFINRAKDSKMTTRKPHCNVTELTLSEIEDAEIVLLKLVQEDSFEGMKGKLKDLQPFEDHAGLLRARSKIAFRNDTENFRLPILLPCKHPVVAILIRNKHEELCHAGVQVMMSTLREKYWIIKARKTIRQIVKTCSRCRRFKTTHADVLATPLPELRVNDSWVFQTTGIDLAGPLHLRDGQKAWFVLFTCAVFRAVHIEVVTSLSTDAFLLALRRFIARRGRPEAIYSDNGTNFVGAENAFEKIDWKKISKEALIKRMKWIFIPPSAAWWGGWWERLIGMTKEILRSVLGKACLTYEELSTVLCEAEGVLNNRPLTYLSEELEELLPLTPAMFLREIKDDRVPDLEILDDGSVKLNKRYQYRQKLKQDIRKRFRTEYLGQLKYSSSKTKRQRKTLSVGQVVLIGNDKDKRLMWPLAKVLELYPGKDGHARVARLKTQNGELIRPLQRLYPLELEDEQATTLSLKQHLNEDSGVKNPDVKNTDVKKKETIEPPKYVTKSGREIKQPRRLIEQ